MHLDIGILEEEEYGFQCFSVNFADIYNEFSRGSQHPFEVVLLTSFGDLGECKTSTSLKVDIVGVDKSAQGSQRIAGEEICLGPLMNCKLIAVLFDCMHIRSRGKSVALQQLRAHSLPELVRKGHLSVGLSQRSAI